MYCGTFIDKRSNMLAHSQSIKAREKIRVWKRINVEVATEKMKVLTQAVEVFKFKLYIQVSWPPNVLELPRGGLIKERSGR